MWENTAWRQMWKASKSTNDNKRDKCAEWYVSAICVIVAYDWQAKHPLVDDANTTNSSILLIIKVKNTEQEVSSWSVKKLKWFLVVMTLLTWCFLSKIRKSRKIRFYSFQISEVYTEKLCFIFCKIVIIWTLLAMGVMYMK
jgi:hypothetical protein